MEPNTSLAAAAAAWGSPVLDHGEPSVLLSPAFSPAPPLSPGLLLPTASESWYPQPAAGNGSLSSVSVLGGVGGQQWEQGQSSSSSSPARSFGGLFAGDESAAAWATELEEIMPPSFFSPPPPSSAGVTALQSGGAGDNTSVGFAQPPPPSSGSELVAPQLPPIHEEEEEEEIDVSAFLVSDPEDLQLPSLPQMGGGGGGASASWMAPPSLPQSAAGSMGNNNNSPTMSTCGMLSTRKGYEHVQAVQQMMMPPLSQQQGGAGGIGNGNNDCNGFVHVQQQPSSSAASSSVLVPLPPNLEGHADLLLSSLVKEEEMDYVDAATAAQLYHPDFVSLVDDDDQDGLLGLYHDAIPLGGSGSGALNAWATKGKAPSFAPAEETESKYNVFGSWGGGGSSSSSRSGFAHGTWGGSSSSPSLAGKTPCLDGSCSSIDVYGSSSSMPKLSIGGKKPSNFGRPRLPRAAAGRAGRPRGGATKLVFTDAEVTVIRKDKKLQELLRTDPKKVKRILYNRAYTAMSTARKMMHMQDLERLVVTLEKKRESLCAELQSLEEGSAALMTEKTEMQLLIGELEQQAMLKDAVREGLRSEIEKLKHLKLN